MVKQAGAMIDGRRGRWMTVLIAFVLMAVTQPAAAQPGREVFPEPITSRDLDAYALRLQLSEQQRVMADTLHESYLERYRELRDGDLEDYESRSTNMLRSLMAEPDASAVKTMLREADQLMSRIAALDRRFFDELGAALSPEQLEQMPGVRQARERVRNQAGLVQFAMRANEAASVDLSELVLDLDLGPDEWERVEPGVRSYERSLTTAVEKMRDATSGMFATMAEELEQLSGGGAGGRPDFRLIRDAWMEAAEPVAEEAAALSELNVRSYKSLREMLSAEKSRELEEEFLDEAYGEIARGRGSLIEQLDEAATRVPGLTDAERDRVAALRDQLAADHRTLADQMIGVVDDIRSERGVMGFGRRGGPEPGRREELQSLRERQERLNEDAKAALEAMFGPERFEAINEALVREMGGADAQKKAALRNERERIAGRGPGGRFERRGARGGAGEMGLPSGPDRFVPAAISPKEVRMMASVLGLDETKSMVLDQLYDTYRKKYEVVTVRQVEPLLEMQEGMWAWNQEERRLEAPAPAEVDRLFEMRQTARQAILELDRAFFEDVALVTVDADDESAQAKLASLEALRKRLAVLPRGQSVARFGMPGARMVARLVDEASSTAGVDLGWVVMTAELSPEQRETLVSSLRAYDAEATPMFEERMTQMIGLTRGIERAMAESIGTDEEEGEGGRMRGRRGWGRVIEERHTEAIERLQSINRSIGEVNERTLEGMAATLESAEASGALRLAYQKLAYPDVYDDARAVEPLLRKALRLPDLSERQRSDLSDLLMDYMSEYRELSESLIEAHAAEDELELSQQDEGNRFSRWEDRRKIGQRIERLEFDRDELSERTRRRLLLILTDAQQRELGIAPAQG